MKEQNAKVLVHFKNLRGPMTVQNYLFCICTRKGHLLLSCSKLSGSGGFQCRPRSSGGVNISVHTTEMHEFKFVGFLLCFLLLFTTLLCCKSQVCIGSFTLKIYQMLYIVFFFGSTWFDSVWLEGVY